MKDKKKPAMALVISVGPKMPKKPTDTATPDKMKKYGSVKKGSPVPDWAKPKNANRNDVIHSDGQNLTNEMKNLGGDAYNYGGAYNQMQVQRQAGEGVGLLNNNVKDFATGTYGDTNAFAGGQSAGFYNSNPLDTRLVHSSEKDEQGETEYNVAGQRPKGGRTSVINANKFMPQQGSPLSPPIPNPAYNQPVQENPAILNYNKKQELNQRINPSVTDIAGRNPQEYVNSNPYLQNQQGQVQTGEPMNLAFRLLKESMEVGTCTDCEGTGKIVFRDSQARGNFDPNPKAGKIGDPCPSCGGTRNAPIPDRAFASMQQKLTGEPMNLAFRLLKESIDPKKLAEMRAARDAARAQMGQQNSDRGGDVDPI